MPNRLGNVDALVYPDRRQIFVTGTGDYDYDDPRDNGRFVHTAEEILYVISSSERLHEAAVRLEAWDTEPPPPGGEWDDVEETPVWFSDGAVIIQALYEAALTDDLPLGEPGWYRARVHTRGRAALERALEGRYDSTDAPREIGRAHV